MVGIATYLPILTLNVNGLYSPIKIHQLSNWIKKGNLKICCLQETYLRDRNKHCLRMKRWKKIDHANGLPKQAGVSILILHKIDFKSKLVKRE
jgi:exonuclease III